MLALFGVMFTPLQALGQGPYGLNLNNETQLGIPQSVILTIQPERLFSSSAFGRRISQEIEAEVAAFEKIDFVKSHSKMPYIGKIFLHY